MSTLQKYQQVFGERVGSEVLANLREYINADELIATEPPATIIGFGFSWHNSLQGFQYWKDLMRFYDKLRM